MYGVNVPIIILIRITVQWEVFVRLEFHVLCNLIQFTKVYSRNC